MYVCTPLILHFFKKYLFFLNLKNHVPYIIYRH